MRVLLTGAAGFIGSHVARHLVSQGDEVTAVVSPGGSTDRITDILPALSTIDADLDSTDLDLLVSRAGPDACIHLAWHVEPSSYLTDVRENLASLVGGTRLLSALNGADCPRAVIAGTCLEPGTLVDGETEPARTIYAAAKSALHEVGMHLNNTKVACAHVFYLYGPAEDPRRVVPMVIRACLERRRIDVSSGEQKRDFLHVEDVASAIVSIIKSDVRGGVDVCSGATTPLRDVFRAIGAATGRADLIDIGNRPSVTGEPLDIAGDGVTLAGTGWQPRWSLEAGIARTVDWWRARLAAGDTKGITRSPIDQPRSDSG
jgi:nucleoside-diphosphate-sugar epimerase